MKKIIAGKLYDTETAREICSDSFGNVGDFHHEQALELFGDKIQDG